MTKEQKLILEACILTLRTTLGNMSATEADRTVGAVIQILNSMAGSQL